MSLPARLLRILTLHCEEASALLSQEQDQPLGLPERLAVRGHVLVCAPCRRLQSQLRFLRGAIRRRNDTSGPGKESLSPEAHSRIAVQIAEATREMKDEADRS